MTWVLDASAVLCWLLGEAGAQRVEHVLADDERLLIHAVNLVEVRYFLLRRGSGPVQTADDRMRAVGIEVVRTLDDALLARAVELKAFYAPIALGDAFAVALALEQEATLLTTDRGELEKVAAAGVCTIEFLR